MIDGMATRQGFWQLMKIVGMVGAVLYFDRVILTTVKGLYETRNLENQMVSLTNSYILGKLFSLSVGQHTSENSSRRTSVITRGENALVQLTTRLLYDVLPLMAMVILMSGVIVYHDIYLGGILIACIGVYLILVFRFNKSLRQGLRKLERLNNDDDKVQREFVSRAPLVLYNGQQARVYRETADSWDKVVQFRVPFWARFDLRMGGYSSILVFGEVSTFALGVYYSTAGIMSAGEILACWSMIRMATYQSINLGSQQRDMIQRIASIERLFEMMRIEGDVKESDNPIKPEIKGHIEFRDLVYAHEPRMAKSLLEQDEDEVAIGTAEPFNTSEVLKGVSFTIPAGKITALVGRSGAGKSTIIHALLRARDPISGQILVDGHDLRELSMHHYLDQVGVVEQRVDMFDNTLRYNLTFGLNGRASEVTTEELDRVCKIACVDKFFHKLEQGYETRVGERGVRLSGGECQRAGIARALIKDPSILIFDEATSNLDSESEGDITDAMLRSSEGRTTILIAHRLSTVRHADKIIVIDDGRVVGEGAHAELIKTCAVYQSLVKRQTEQVQEVF